MRARLEINETAPQSVSTQETTMNDYRVYTKTNNGRIIAETTVQADNIESAQRKAFRQAKKDGLIPNEKHNASYGTMGWVANGENQYRRSVVFGDRFKSRAYELHLEMIWDDDEAYDDSKEALDDWEYSLDNDLDAMKKEQERVTQEWLLYFNSSDMECLMHANRLYTKSNVLASDIKYLEELIVKSYGGVALPLRVIKGIAQHTQDRGSAA